MSTFQCAKCQSTRCIKLIDLDANQIISDSPMYQHFYKRFDFTICADCGQTDGHFPLQNKPLLTTYSTSEPVSILYQAMRADIKAKGHSV